MLCRLLGWGHDGMPTEPQTRSLGETEWTLSCTMGAYKGRMLEAVGYLVAFVSLDDGDRHGIICPVVTMTSLPLLRHFVKLQL